MKCLSGIKCLKINGYKIFHCTCLYSSWQSVGNLINPKLNPFSYIFRCNGKNFFQYHIAVFL